MNLLEKARQKKIIVNYFDLRFQNYLPIRLFIASDMKIR